MLLNSSPFSPWSESLRSADRPAARTVHHYRPSQKHRAADDLDHQPPIAGSKQIRRPRDLAAIATGLRDRNRRHLPSHLVHHCQRRPLVSIARAVLHRSAAVHRRRDCCECRCHRGSIINIGYRLTRWCIVKSQFKYIAALNACPVPSKPTRSWSSLWNEKAKIGVKTMSALIAFKVL